MRSADDEGEGHWLSGEISKPGALWDLIGMVGQGNWSGQLVVQDTDSKRSIFFERGAVIGAYSNAERERLGEVLYQYGALTREQVQVVADAVTPNVRFGEAAVALGFLTREQLFDLIGKQTEEITFAVMLVSCGSFYFVTDFEAGRLPYRLNLAVTSLLMEGVRRMDEMSCFRARIPSSMHVPERVEGATLAADHEHHAVFQASDGARSVDEIAHTLGLGQFETTRALFQLLQAASVVLHPPRPTGPEAIVTLFNQAISLIMSEVDKAAGNAEVRDQLASFATASGVYDALFRDAGPAPDGTLDAGRITDTIEVLVGGQDSVAMLAQWLYEYASFAMFVAEPILRASNDSDGTAVTAQVAELLAPLAPEG